MTRLINSESVSAGYSTDCRYPLRLDGDRVTPNPDGYCSFGVRVDGRLVRLQFHREAFERAHGRIDAALVLDHLCGNRWCCNPQHLEPVVQAQNVRRGASAKLTASVVEQIRASKLPRVALAAEYGVSPSTISRVARGEQWADGLCPAWTKRVALKGKVPSVTR